MLATMIPELQHQFEDQKAHAIYAQLKNMFQELARIEHWKAYRVPNKNNLTIPPS